ncbi:hypothetical protein ElyMa_005480200 [Elysia marginata]|uniref:Secreted protein n=1 Tax=Elysia marginata TaxID=1093978 RepID=A0AAV4EQC3_9GAST|nr:hypothetical protein ElyMa_005480200 [Elysia marginata]
MLFCIALLTSQVRYDLLLFASVINTESDVNFWPEMKSPLLLLVISDIHAVICGGKTFAASPVAPVRTSTMNGAELLTIGFHLGTLAKAEF